MKQIGFLVLLALSAVPIFAQSTRENFPTPILQNEISGTIAPRDIGDSRLTQHFYTFFADNGDVNLEIETANFDGDIDLFEAMTLRPLVKITVAATAQPDKTSRIVYFRKRTQIVLRIEGRSLANEAAVYRVAFSGSFAAAEGLPQPPADLEPRVAEKSNPDVVAKVNSAGTIIEVLEPPKPIEEPMPTVESKPEKTPTVARRRTSARRKPVVKAKPVAKTVEPTAENPSETAAESLPAKPDESVARRKPAVRATRPKVAPTTRGTKTARASRAKKPIAEKTVKKVDETTASSQPDPLANVQLIILLKNGERVERVMSEVFNVSVDKGQITVITKSGKIERYNLLDVQKMTIE